VKILMDFRIDCPCGEHIVVTEGSAGATLACSCGRPISVPSLPALRVAAGLPPEVSSPEQIIDRLLAAGKFPGTKVCIGCGFETDQVLDVLTVCETQYRTTTDMPLWFKVVALMISLPFGHWFYPRDGTAQWHGRDTIFLLPIPACEHCQRKLRRRKLLKKSMQQIPEYRSLLEKFPWAGVKLRKRSSRPARKD